MKCQKINLLILVVTLSCTSLLSQPKEVTIKSKNILAIVDWYLASCNKYFDSLSHIADKPGIVVIQYYNSDYKVDPSVISKPSYSLIINLCNDERAFYVQLPDYYFFYKDVPVVVYTGFDDMIVTNDSDRKKFNRVMRNRFPKNRLPKYPSYSLHIIEQTDIPFKVISKGYH